MKIAILLCTLFAVSYAAVRPEFYESGPQYAQEEEKVIVAPRSLKAPGRFNEPTLYQEDDLDRVINGEVAKRGAYPYQISLQVGFFGYQHICGGSILNKNAILTAAHCVDTAPSFFNRYRVVAGEHDLSKNEGSEQIIDVSTIKYHEGWNPSQFNNDVAVVKLSKSLTMNSYVATVTLATGVPSKNTKSTVTGWGYVTTSQTRPDILQMLSTIKQDDTIARQHSSYYRTDTQVATYNSNKGVCNGDSGGPLVRSDNRQQYGVVSYGMTPCGQDVTDYYASVVHFRSWIAKYD